MENPITGPYINELKKTHQCATESLVKDRPIPAESDQDAGGGYNADGTIPQS